MSQAPSNTPLTSTSTTAVSTQATSATLASQPTVAGPSASVTAGAGPSTAASRTAADQARKDRTLAEFLLLLDDHDPLIPTEVTDYYLQRVGFDCQDVRLKRLLSLAAQKFVSDIAADAYQHARIRTNAQGGRARTGMTGLRDKTRTTLTMDDLASALGEYGINARKPDFYM